MATATRQRAGHSVPGHRSPVHGPTRAPTFLLRSTQLQQLIGFLKTPKGLDLFRRSFAENMMYKVSKYRELLTEAERESEHQIEVIDIRVADLRRRAKVSEDTCNWEIFESVSAGYREAMERAARLEALLQAAQARHAAGGRDAVALRDDLVDSLYGLAAHDVQSHIINRVADLIGSFLKDPALFRSKPLNLMLVGSPGSGKTTLAAAIGVAFARAGIFVGDRLVEAGRAELVAQYEGQTVARTRSFLMSHLDGGVIFVDEAYAITPWQDGKPEGYGAEAAAAMVEFMTRYAGLYCLIVAGYEKEMVRYFLTANEGLARRFPYKFVLRDLTCEELLVVFKRQLLLQQQVGALEGTAAAHGEAYFTREAWRYLTNVVRTATQGITTHVDEFDPATRRTYHGTRRFVPRHELVHRLFENQAGAMVTLAEEALQVLMALLPYEAEVRPGDRHSFGPHGLEVMRSILEQRIRNSALSDAEPYLSELNSLDRNVRAHTPPLL